MKLLSRNSTARRRIAVAATTVAVAIGSLAGAAQAANYDSASGFLKTPPGATATVAMQCGRTGQLVLQTGAVAPQYFSYKATNSSGVTTGWTPYRKAYSLTKLTPITVPGYWVVEVRIAQSANGVWYFDDEIAPVTVQPAGYANAWWCKVTG
jgi:hypothetical protein